MALSVPILKHFRVDAQREGQSFPPSFSKQEYVNSLYSGGLFHCYMLVESICHFRGVGSNLLLLCYF